MRKLMAVVLILAPFLLSSVSFASEGGYIETYLVGTFDLRVGYTVFQIVNPTARDLEVLVAFFDDNEKLLGCRREKLSHNDLLEIDIRTLKLPAGFGVVKIVSHIKKIPCPGIIGFQRNYFKSGFAESNLASIPDCFLYDEFKMIIATRK